MLTIDFAAHNQASQKLWKDFWSGKAERVPMTVGCNFRMIVLDPKLNAKGHNWQTIFSDPGAMLEAQADFIDWYRFNMPCDQPLGPVEQYDIGVSFLNSYDALYFGCPLHFRDGQLPDTEPWLIDDKNAIFDLDLSDPLAQPWVARSLEFYDAISAQRGKWQRNGATIGKVMPTFAGNDGPFTIACAVRPPDRLMLDLVDDPDYMHRLLGFITDRLIDRIRAVRARHGLPLKSGNGTWMADDACTMLSVDTYREFVLPCHKRLVDALVDLDAIRANNGTLMMHLCGGASHLFPTIARDVGANAFDTGFPIDHGQVRAELGPEIYLWGGPGVQVLKDGTPRQVFEETRRILQSGVKQGGRFVLREGNNLAPCTPTENIAAMYEACKQFGQLP